MHVLKITVEQRSRNDGLHHPWKPVQPSPEDLVIAYQGAVLIFEKLGGLANLIELIKVSWYQPAADGCLWPVVQVFVCEPGSGEKFEIPIHLLGWYTEVCGHPEHDLRGSFENAEQLAEILTSAIKLGVRERTEELQARAARLEVFVPAAPA